MTNCTDLVEYIDMHVVGQVSLVETATDRRMDRFRKGAVGQEVVDVVGNLEGAIRGLRSAVKDPLRI